MTRKERDNRRTDQAWNKVYHRLEKDGLLTCKEKEGVMPYGDIPRLTTRKIVLLGLQVAAIISFFLIIHFNRTRGSRPQPAHPAEYGDDNTCHDT